MESKLNKNHPKWTIFDQNWILILLSQSSITHFVDLSRGCICPCWEINRGFSFPWCLLAWTPPTLEVIKAVISPSSDIRVEAWSWKCRKRGIRAKSVYEESERHQRKWHLPMMTPIIIPKVDWNEGLCSTYEPCFWWNYLKITLTAWLWNNW